MSRYSTSAKKDGSTQVAFGFLTGLVSFDYGLTTVLSCWRMRPYLLILTIPTLSVLGYEPRDICIKALGEQWRTKGKVGPTSLLNKISEGFTTRKKLVSKRTEGVRGKWCCRVVGWRRFRLSEIITSRRRFFEPLALTAREPERRQA